MDLQLWLAFAAASLVMAAIPGPGVASIVGFAFSSGRGVALASVAGMAVGNATAIAVSLAGAGAILASSAFAFAVLKTVGAVYLIAIGVIALLKSRPVPADGAPGRPISMRMAFLTNVMVGSFHPKTILFFIAFATQFMRPDQPYLPQAAIMTATFTFVAATTDTLYALTAAQASGALRSPVVRRWTQRAGGAVLVAAGVATAAMRR